MFNHFFSYGLKCGKLDKMFCDNFTPELAGIIYEKLINEKPNIFLLSPGNEGHLALLLYDTDS